MLVTHENSQNYRHEIAPNSHQSHTDNYSVINFYPLSKLETSQIDYPKRIQR